jgi:glycerate kinase
MTQQLKILIAPSGFKESLSPIEATNCMARGLARVWPDAELRLAPMADGGEGFVETIISMTGGEMRRISVTGPLGEPVDACFGLAGGDADRRAIIDIASAAGLSLVPRDRRDPSRTSSRGAGQLIRTALDAGVRHLLIGCGDSGVHDAGMGLARELGIRFLDASGMELGEGGVELLRLEHIDVSSVDPRLADIDIEVSVNWETVLVGDGGVTRRHAAQKGATPRQLEDLERALTRFGAVVQSQFGLSIGEMPGAGASGGIGAALAVFTGATLRPRQEIMCRYIDIDALLDGVDIVFTGEGSLDGQTALGKVPVHIARIAARRGIPAVAVAGTLGLDADDTLAHGIDAYAGILERPCSLDAALDDASALLERATERAARLLDVGLRIGIARVASGERAPGTMQLRTVSTGPAPVQQSRAPKTPMGGNRKPSRTLSATRGVI